MGIVNFQQGRRDQSWGEGSLSASIAGQLGVRVLRRAAGPSPRASTISPAVRLHPRVRADTVTLAGTSRGHAPRARSGRGQEACVHTDTCAQTVTAASHQPNVHHLAGGPRVCSPNAAFFGHKRTKSRRPGESRCAAGTPEDPSPGCKACLSVCAPRPPPSPAPRAAPGAVEVRSPWTFPHCNRGKLPSDY